MMGSPKAFQTRAGWEPVWWEPVVWRGAAFQWAATLHGAVPGMVRGGELIVDGRRFPIMGDDQVISVSLTPDQVDTLTDGSVAELYIDLNDVGRVLWLRGKLTVGGNR